MKATTKAALLLVVLVVLVVLVAFLLAPCLAPVALDLVQHMVDPLAAAWAPEFSLAIVQLVVMGIILVVVGIIGLALYILPVLVALMRKHPDAVAISALSILLGWTVLGWVFALVWAFSGVRKQVQQGTVPQPGGSDLSELPRFGSTTARQDSRD